VTPAIGLRGQWSLWSVSNGLPPPYGGGALAR